MESRRIARHLAVLDEWFAACQSAVVAFSGGVDSALVAWLARRALGRDRCLAVVGDSPSLKRRDHQEARAFAAAHDIPVRVVATDELHDPAYRANAGDRCFHCKTELFTRLEAVRREVGFAMILGGENADDHADYRPGLRAVENHGVRGPLAECGLGKADLRAVASHLGLPCWDRPASPCLGSRIPHFSEVTADKLQQVEAAEEWLAARGFAVARVRHHGDLARVEVPAGEVGRLQAMASELAAALRPLGFARIEVDPEGFVSGKLNRALS